MLDAIDRAAQGAHALAEGSDVRVARVVTVFQENVVPQHPLTPGEASPQPPAHRGSGSAAPGAVSPARAVRGRRRLDRRTSASRFRAPGGQDVSRTRAPGGMIGGELFSVSMANPAAALYRAMKASRSAAGKTASMSSKTPPQRSSS